MKKLDGEDTRQQKHLPGLEQAQIRGQEKFGNEQAVLIVLAPEPRKRKRVLAVCNNRDLCPTVRVGEAGVAAKYRVRGDADCDDPAEKNKPRESCRGSRLKAALTSGHTSLHSALIDRLGWGAWSPRTVGHTSVYDVRRSTGSE